MVRSVARWALIRCRRFRSASLWLRPFRSVAGAEHSPSVAIRSLPLLNARQRKSATAKQRSGSGRVAGAGGIYKKETDRAGGAGNPRRRATWVVTAAPSRANRRWRWRALFVRALLALASEDDGSARVGGNFASADREIREGDRRRTARGHGACVDRCVAEGGMQPLGISAPGCFFSTDPLERILSAGQGKASAARTLCNLFLCSTVWIRLISI
jgi:hypothetical protein